MKRFLLVLLIVATLFCAVSCKKNNTPEGMQNAATEDAAFDLFVPAAWLPLTGSGVSGARYSDTDASNVTALTYLPDRAMNAETYWNEVALPQYGNGTLGDFTVLAEQCGDAVLGGKDAKKYVFTYVFGDVSYEVMQYITLKDDVVYILTYTALGTNFAAHLDDVERIRAEFVFR